MKALANVHLLLGIVACRSFLVTIRPINSGYVLKFDGRGVVLGSDRMEESASFRITVKKVKELKLLGMKLRKRKHLILISPGSNQKLYLWYKKKKGLFVQKKKKYWEYKDMGNGGYMLKAGKNKCLGMTSGNGVGVSKCGQGEEQVFVFEEKDQESSTSANEDEHVTITTEMLQVPETIHVGDRSLEISSSSYESSDSEDSDSSVTKPVFINLNMKNKKMDADGDGRESSSSVLSPSVSTTTVYVSVTRSLTKSVIKSLTKSVPSAPIVTIIEKPLSASTRHPSSIASFRGRMTPPDEPPYSVCNSNELPETHEVPRGGHSDESYGGIRNSESLGLDLKFYPELGRLLKGNVYGRTKRRPRRKAGSNDAKVMSRGSSGKELELASGCTYLDTRGPNPLYQDAISAPICINIE
ncbi:hypothetical protein [Encephalitozoon cuniculi GB-M1]|uniref:Ricin B lectin domain-containing protein n=1 Tax=Encephalitozoon cuniculi (strain GB-M1) TaxID=284813 RepID=Q8SUZ4_ENCCU|nr:uncharacterized protein ECU07_0990 [Encephalitozoon cuniculi GB-M1]CAD25631.1 hypothetical protein [Encephalitozoon cuniculi GB-M1]